MHTWNPAVVAQYVFFIGLLWLVMIVCLHVRRHYRRVANSHPWGVVPPPTIPNASRHTMTAARAAGARESSIASDELRSCEAQIHDLARNLMGELNSRLRLVQLATVQAETAANRLEVALARVEMLNPEGIDQHETELRRLIGWEFTRTASADPLDGDPHEPKPVASSTQARGATDSNCLPLDDRRRERIQALARAGHNSAAIAERVGSHVADVELVLSLGTASR